MDKKINFKHRFQYWFDNLMTGGIFPIIVFLFLIATLLTILISILLVITHISFPASGIKVDPQNNALEVFWISLMHLIDQGTITADDGASWPFRLVMMIPTSLGILFIATVVGLVTSRIQIVLVELRKGRSLVLEKNHIVILGWSSKIFSILQELIKANANQRRSRIVILAEKDKVEMEDEIAEKIDYRGNTKIICRTGDPIDLDDLEIVNHHFAKSIIIVSSDEEISDIENIKGILAIVNHPNRKQDLYHLVAEIKSNRNQEVANLIGGDELTLTVSDDLIARMAVQTCLQSGLSSVYNTLLDFNSVDIYFHHIEELNRRTFGDALFAYEELIPIGILRLNGILLLNPRMATKIKEGDRIILIAEDDDQLPPAHFEPKPIFEEHIIETPVPMPKTPKKILILGWNEVGVTIVEQLENYVIPGSEVSVVSSDIEPIRKELAQAGPLHNLKTNFTPCNITSRKELNALNISRYSHVMILSDSRNMNTQEADAHTLVTLMHLRDIKEHSEGDFTIVSEMLDLKNRSLAEVAKPDDFIISDHIISLIISQLAENRDLNMVFNELFDSHGAEFYLKPVSRYLDVSQFKTTNFYTVMEAAARLNEVAIGYRICAFVNDSKQDYGIVLNPPKSEEIRLFSGDKIIVLAED